MIQKERPILLKRAPNELSRPLRLNCVVVSQIPGQDIRVQSFHLCLARLCKAMFRSSGLYGFIPAVFNIPLRLEIWMLAAFNSTLCEATFSLNSSLSPGFNFRKSRTSLGIVVCPLLVNV